MKFENAPELVTVTETDFPAVKNPDVVANRTGHAAAGATDPDTYQQEAQSVAGLGGNQPGHVEADPPSDDQHAEEQHNRQRNVNLGNGVDFGDSHDGADCDDTSQQDTDKAAKGFSSNGTHAETDPIREDRPSAVSSNTQLREPKSEDNASNETGVAGAEKISVNKSVGIAADKTNQQADNRQFGVGPADERAAEESSHARVLTFEQVSALSDRIQVGISAESKLAEHPESDDKSELEGRVKKGLDAQMEMFDKNKGLVRFIVRREFADEASFGSLSDLFDEIIDVGDMHLYMAIRQFNPKRGVEFSSYASRAIKNGIRYYLGKNREPVSFGKREVTQRGELHALREIFRMEHDGAEPTREELATMYEEAADADAHRHQDPRKWRSIYKMDAARVQSLGYTQQSSISSLSERVGIPESDVIETILPAQVSLSAEETAHAARVRREVREAVVGAFDTAGLTTAERQIIALRLTDIGPKLLNSEIGRMLGMRHVEVTGHERKARRKLKERAGPDLLKLLQEFE